MQYRLKGSPGSLILFRFCLIFRHFRFIPTCNNNILLQRYGPFDLTKQIRSKKQTCGSWKSYELDSIENQTATRLDRQGRICADVLLPKAKLYIIPHYRGLYSLKEHLLTFFRGQFTFTEVLTRKLQASCAPGLEITKTSP